MSDTAPCSHHQFIGQREFCPDCGLSRTEVLVESCAPFLKDDETPADCIRRNRKDVDGCLTMLVAEKRKNDALRAQRDEAVALLREWTACATNIGSGEAVAKVEQVFVAQCRDFLAPDSATHREGVAND